MNRWMLIGALAVLAGCVVHVDERRDHRPPPPPAPPPVCATCHGSGAVGCGICGTKGTVVVTSNCSTCAGAGSLACTSCKGAGAFACSKCEGKGEVLELGVGKVLKVKVQCNKCQ